MTGRGEGFETSIPIKEEDTEAKRSSEELLEEIQVQAIAPLGPAPHTRKRRSSLDAAGSDGGRPTAAASPGRSR